MKKTSVTITGLQADDKKHYFPNMKQDINRSTTTVTEIITDTGRRKSYEIKQLFKFEL
jgi:hypothetical protein